MNMRTIFAAASMIGLMSCSGSMTAPGGAIEAEICRQIGGALPTRSHSDTAQTAAEIQRLYAVYDLTCPEWAHLVP